jgi:hypothetical protein
MSRVINSIIDNINDCFRGNSLSLYFDKIYFLQFRTKNSHEINIKIRCDNKQIKNMKNIRFLGLDIDSSLPWKDHIDQMMFKIGSACYAIMYVKHFMSQDTLRTNEMK